MLHGSSLVQVSGEEREDTQGEGWSALTEWESLAYPMTVDVTATVQNFLEFVSYLGPCIKLKPVANPGGFLTNGPRNVKFDDFPSKFHWPSPAAKNVWNYAYGDTDHEHIIPEVHYFIQYRKITHKSAVHPELWIKRVTDIANAMNSVKELFKKNKKFVDILSKRKRGAELYDRQQGAQRRFSRYLMAVDKGGHGIAYTHGHGYYHIKPFHEQKDFQQILKDKPKSPKAFVAPKPKKRKPKPKPPPEAFDPSESPITLSDVFPHPLVVDRKHWKVQHVDHSFVRNSDEAGQVKVGDHVQTLQFSGWETGEVRQIFQSKLKGDKNRPARWDLLVHVFETFEGHESFSKEIWKTDIVDKIQKPKPKPKPKPKTADVEVEHEPDEKEAEVEVVPLALDTYMTEKMNSFLRDRINTWVQIFAKWNIFFVTEDLRDEFEPQLTENSSP